VRQRTLLVGSLGDHDRHHRARPVRDDLRREPPGDVAPVLRVRDVRPDCQAEPAPALADEAEQHHRFGRPEAEQVRDRRRQLTGVGEVDADGSGTGLGGAGIHARTLAAPDAGQGLPG
jgi:hypothetical protein